jgi:hypothetical protein
VRQVGEREAGAVVAHRDPHQPAAVALGRIELDHDRSAWRRVAQRVLEQVLEHLHHALAVDEQRSGPFVHASIRAHEARAR